MALQNLNEITWRDWDGGGGGVKEEGVRKECLL